MGGLDRLGALANADDPEETTEEEKEKIDREAVRNLLFSHDDFVPPDPLHQITTADQLIETARWALAMDDVYRMEKRRLVAQKKVAEHTEPSDHAQKRTDDGENDRISPQAVQDAARRHFEERRGKRNAQEHFDEILEDVEEAYQHMEEQR